MREHPTPNPPSPRANDAPPANGQAEVPPWAAFSPGHARFVRFVVVLTVAITLLCTASIYWRSANVYEPTSYITVQGDESLNGTEVVVRGSHASSVPVITTLSKDNDYISTIFLYPGSYTVTASLKGEPLARADFSISGRKAATVNLTTRKPGAQSRARDPNSPTSLSRYSGRGQG